MINHSLEVVRLLLKEEIHFSILCYIKNVKFSPVLPNEVGIKFKSLMMFGLIGHTFTTASIEKDVLMFEAAFGEDNFVSTISVPLKNIVQIQIGENVIFINPMSSPDNEEKEQENDEVLASMEAIFNNPKNQKILKK